MAFCPRCGSSKSMADGVLCPACITSEEDARNSAALPSSGEEMPKPYGWGKVQGVLLILGSFRLLSHDTTLESAESPASSLLLFVFNMALGICILRRNRLILPLMAITVVLMVLSAMGASLTHDEFGPIYAFGVVIWALYAVYYYRRRSEFKRWV